MGKSQVNVGIAHGGNGIRPFVLAMRYRKPKKSVKEITKIKEVKKITLYDREIYLAYKKYFDYFQDKRGKFDKIFFVDPFNRQEVVDKLDFRYFMGNYFTDPKVSNTDMKMIWDSGALQVSRGVSEFLDPRKVMSKMESSKVKAGVG